jgi:hypothetical protein
VGRDGSWEWDDLEFWECLHETDSATDDDADLPAPLTDLVVADAVDGSASPLGGGGVIGGGILVVRGGVEGEGEVCRDGGKVFRLVGRASREGEGSAKSES